MKPIKPNYSTIRYTEFLYFLPQNRSVYAHVGTYTSILSYPLFICHRITRDEIEINSTGKRLFFLFIFFYLIPFEFYKKINVEYLYCSKTKTFDIAIQVFYSPRWKFVAFAEDTLRVQGKTTAEVDFSLPTLKLKSSSLLITRPGANFSDWFVLRKEISSTFGN